MLPPPTTSASSQPRSWTSWISRAKVPMASASMPKPASPASASPLIFSRTRRYRSEAEAGASAAVGDSSGAPSPLRLGLPVIAFALLDALSQLEADEAADGDVLAQLGDRIGDDLTNGLA